MTQQAATSRRRSVKPSREAFFARVVGPDDTLTFVNVTEYVGKQLPFRKPKATLAMSVTDAAVCFSLLHITVKAAGKTSEKIVAMPRGSFARSQRKVATLDNLKHEDCYVEVDGETHRFSIERDGAGLARLTWDDLDSDEPVIKIDGRATQLQLFMWSQAARRPIAISFVGHVGKPGTADTLLRAASMALFSLSALPEFRILTGIDVVDVPPPANRYAATVSSRRSAGRAVWELAVWLFHDQSLGEPVAHGPVAVEIDLENANPTTNRLLIKLTPSEAVAPLFDEYRTTMDSAIMEMLRSHLGDEDIAAMTYDIVLGSVTPGMVERLVDAIKAVGGLDLTETRARAHPTA